MAQALGRFDWPTVRWDVPLWVWGLRLGAGIWILGVGQSTITWPSSSPIYLPLAFISGWLLYLIGLRVIGGILAWFAGGTVRDGTELYFLNDEREIGSRKLLAVRVVTAPLFLMGLIGGIIWYWIGLRVLSQPSSEPPEAEAAGDGA